MVERDGAAAVAGRRKGRRWEGGGAGGEERGGGGPWDERGGGGGPPAVGGDGVRVRIGRGVRRQGDSGGILSRLGGARAVSLGDSAGHWSRRPPVPGGLLREGLRVEPFSDLTVPGKVIVLDTQNGQISSFFE